MIQDKSGESVTTRMRFEVHPEPSADEMAAIVAALRSLKSRQSVTATARVSGWQMAARREALHVELHALVGGWRQAARLEQ